MASNKEHLRRLFECVDAGDFDTAVELVGGAATIHLPGQPSLDAVGWRQFSESFMAAFSDARHSLDTVIEEGNRVAIEGTWSGTHTRPFATPQGDVPPSGNEVSMSWCGIFTFHGDRKEVHIYFDQMELATKLGMVPADV